VRDCRIGREKRMRTAHMWLVGRKKRKSGKAGCDCAGCASSRPDKSATSTLFSEGGGGGGKKKEEGMSRALGLIRSYDSLLGEKKGEERQQMKAADH